MRRDIEQCLTASFVPRSSRCCVHCRLLRALLPRACCQPALVACSRCAAVTCSARRLAVGTACFFLICFKYPLGCLGFSMQIDLLKERNRAWSRCAAEVGDAAGALYFMASRRACCCLTGFWSEMEEKSKGTCTRSTPQEEREESQGSTEKGVAAGAAGAAGAAAASRAAGKHTAPAQAAPTPHRKLLRLACILRPISEQLAKKHRVLAALLASISQNQKPVHSPLLLASRRRAQNLKPAALGLCRPLPASGRNNEVLF